MSFIVRVWTEQEETWPTSGEPQGSERSSHADGEPQMRGEIEHLGTGEKRFFPNHTSLLTLIEMWRRETA
jgi:hypothetical protein